MIGRPDTSVQSDRTLHGSGKHRIHTVQPKYVGSTANICPAIAYPYSTGKGLDSARSHVGLVL